MPGGIDEMELIKDFVKDPEFAVQPENVAAPVSEEAPKDITPTEETTAVENTVAPEAETPVSAEVKVEAPVVAPEETKVPEVDYDKWLGETSGGRIKAKDDLKKILDEYDQTKELLNTDTYQYAAKLSAWEKAGHPKDLFAPIQEMTPDEIKTFDSRDLVTLKLKFENPLWTEEDINLLIDDEYKQDPDLNTETVVRAGKLRMEREAASFRTKLNELKQLTIVPKADDLRAQAAQAETLRKDTWKQNLPKFVGEFNKISIPLDKAGKDVFDFVLTKQQQDELLKDMDRLVSNVPVKFDEDGIKAFQTAMRKEALNKYFNEISTAIATKAASKKTEEVIKEIHNPTGAKQESRSPEPQSKSEEDVAYEKIIAQELFGNGRR